MSKNAKGLLSSRIVGLLKTEKQCFKTSELFVLEPVLKDDLLRYNWLYSLLNTALNTGSLVSSEDLNCYSSSQRHDLATHVPTVETLKTEIARCEERICLMKKQKEWLKKRTLKSDLNSEENNMRTASELKLKQLLHRLKTRSSDEIVFPKANDVLDSIISQLHANLEGISESDFEDLLNELSLLSTDTDKQIFVISFYEAYFTKLSLLKDKLSKIQKRCFELFEYYNSVVKKELSWRKELNCSLANDFQNCSCREYRLNDITKVMDSFALINNVELPNHELHDELNELLDHLKEKIASL